MSSKHNKMMQMVNCRLRITLLDGRTFIGQMLAYDKHMNLVIADCEEFRRVKTKASKSIVGGSASEDVDGGVPAAPSVDREERRTLGLIVLRGETIVSMSVESGPPPSGGNKARVPASLRVGAGVGRAAGRGIPIAPPGAAPVGLAGPIPGMYVRPGMAPPPMMMVGRGMPMPPPGSYPPGTMPFRPPGAPQ